jgi:hypothetical protein
VREREREREREGKMKCKWISPLKLVLSPAI